ncbi:hypothetical protein M441DRAFT_312879 [Trichoderma asperellum CBS 433.97]|uniref:Uncharacterized protein n=1 Tax=Trichoderma asperellum (strain ATCC 204424 / CBS 433.97 / NBRC 101777) TaxID=1042311 RepID=A0A2T3ZKD8_TRIA4|nr:hypothetical protein M441DRAFT_312879 [Trichoderma asperellum CBS 433.97]PTB45266.1 hypothetical protein M441DRAFT_312879 [Trichoderma asperellum CBS 433.97]
MSEPISWKKKKKKSPCTPFSRATSTSSDKGSRILKSSSHPGQAPMCNEKGKGLSDVHQHPPCPCARRQTTNRVEIIKRTTLYTAEARGDCRHPCGQGERTRKKFTLGCRGYTIINQGGFDGSFGNQSKRQIL